MSFVRWKSSTDVIVKINGDDLEVQLTAKKKDIINQIQVQLVENADESISVINQKVEIREPSSGYIDMISTDAKGIASFNMPSNIGRHTYEISLVNLASDYDNLTSNVIVEVEYDANGNIIYATRISGDAISVSKTNQNEETEIKNVAFVKIGLDLSSTSEKYTFNLVKVDQNDPTKKLSDVEYTITVKNNDVERNISKTTNGFGELSFGVVKKNNTTITIQEEKTKKGYVLDSTVKTIELEVDANGDFKNKNSLSNLSVDTSNKIITFTDKNLKKIDSNNKANINFYITKKDQNGNLLGNVDLNLEDLNSGVTYSLTTDNFGKVTSPDITINNVGTYTFALEEVSTLPGYILPNTKVILQLEYEIINDEMKVTSYFITQGEKYIINKEYKSYETDTTYQFDVTWTVQNTQNSTNPADYLLLDIKNIDQVTNNDIYDGNYDVTLKYSNGGQYTLWNIPVINGIEIPNIYLDQLTTIELIESNNPLGYDPDVTNKTITIDVDASGKPYITSHSNNITCQIIEKTNVDYSISNVLEVEIMKQRKDLKFDVKIKKGIEDISDYYVPGVKFDFSFNGTVQPTQTTDSNGEILYNNLSGTGKLTLLIQEVSVPYGYKLNTNIIKVVLNRRASDFNIEYIQAESDLPAQNVVIDYIQQEVVINIKNDLDFTINIEKVDSLNSTNKLQGAKFEVTSSETVQTGQTTNDTDINGETSAVFDTVVANKTVEYTIKEIQAPNGYRTCKDFKLKMGFGASGKIVSYDLLTTNNTTCDWAEIYLPQQYIMNTTTGQYELKDIYLDNSEIKIIVKDNDRYNFVINKVDVRNQSTGGTSDPVTGAVFDIKVSHNGINQCYNKTTLNGLIELKDLEGDGEITIEYEETQAAYGYDNSNLPSGKIVFTKDAQNNTLTLDNSKTTADLSKVSVNNQTGDVELTIENESKFQIGIKTVDAISNDPLNGARYIIKKEINGTIVDTSDAQDTANGGETIFNFGTVYRSQTVRYIISETIAQTGYPQAYSTIDDIVIDLPFDQYGVVGTPSIVKGSSRVKNIEVPNGSSGISYNFNNTGINLEITNGEQDEYTIVVENVNSNNDSIKINGTEFHIIGTNTDGTQQFNLPSPTQNATTNSLGQITIQHVDIQHGFEISLQETKNSDGYVLDDTLKTIRFTAQLSTTGGKIINDSTYANDPLTINGATTDSRIDVIVSNISKTIKIIVKSEPNDVGIAIKKADKNDTLNLLAGARFEIKDNQTGKVYPLITGNNGIGYVNIPMKPNGTYSYTITETQSPLGYKDNSSMSMEIDFNDNKVSDARKGTNPSIFSIDGKQDKYIRTR